MHSRLRPELGTPNPTQFGLDAVRAALGAPPMPSPTEAVAILRAHLTDFAYGTLTDDLCLLAARSSR
jgi:hypothetical protein